MRLLIVPIAASLAACATTGHEQHLEFRGFQVDRGVYVADSGWHFEPQDDGTYVIARLDESGGSIEPCECALETGGSCHQATGEDENGDIIEIWCVDEGCGFCVGGVNPDPDDPEASVRFRLECVDADRVARRSGA